MVIKSYKVMLKPNNKQRTKLFQFANASRFAYNWALAKQQENYKNGGKFINDGDLRKEFTQFKKLEENKWLTKVSGNVPKQAIKDCCLAYKRFFTGKAKPPRFKSKRKSKPSFYQDNVKIQFSDNKVKMEGFTSSKKKTKQKFNWVSLSEKGRIPLDTKYMNPRISYDGLNWWVSVGVEVEEIVSIPINEGIGVDLGIKDLAICSDESTYININKTKKVRKIKKRLKRLQRQSSKKYDKLKKEKAFKKGERFTKTKNIIKIERKVSKTYKKLNGIRDNHLHKTTTEIVNRKPKFIVLEDLNVSGMMKNRHLAKAVAEQKFYEFKTVLTYKAIRNNIQVIVADRFFPSSKLCSSCGNHKKDLKLKDRTYICNHCGMIINRDKNASYNLKNYGQAIV